MKKLPSKILMIFSLILLLSGCSEDDGMGEVNHLDIEQSILGKWYPQGGTLNGGEYIPYAGDDCDEFGDYQEFLATGDLQFVGYNGVCEADETNVSAYTISGDVLTVTDEFFGDTEFVIQSVTSQQLILRSSYNSPEGQMTELAYFARTRQ